MRHPMSSFMADRRAGPLQASPEQGPRRGPFVALGGSLAVLDERGAEVKRISWMAEMRAIGTAACGPLPKFAYVRLRRRSARRGRRCPLGAHAVAVGLSGRLHCDARARVVPQNSLRDLRSLRSDNCGKSDHEARSRAPTLALRFSSPQKSPPAGSACRDNHQRWPAGRTPPLVQQRRARAGCGAPLRRREPQGSWPRAQRASSSDSSRLSERSDRRERSEFRDGATRPRIAGESARSADRRSEAP